MKQSQINALNILNNVESDSTADLLEKAMGHKYYRREGSPGNYKYYYTEAEYKQAKGKKSEENKENKSPETIEKDGKNYKLQPNGKYLEVSEQGMTKKEHSDKVQELQYNNSRMDNADYADVQAEMGENDRKAEEHHNFQRKLSDKEFTKEELEDKKENPSFDWDSEDAKILAKYGVTKNTLVVKDNLDLFGSPITSLPEGLKVGGNLDLYGSSITSLPKGLEVGGHLSLSETPITSLPEGLKVRGNLYLSKTSITSLTRDDFMEIGGKIFINK